MVFSGTSRGSVMWTSCSSATIQGKSCGWNTEHMTFANYGKHSCHSPRIRKVMKMFREFLLVTVFNVTFITWTFSMLRVAASLVWTRTENEQPVTKEMINKCKWLNYKWSLNGRMNWSIFTVTTILKFSTIWTEESFFSVDPSAPPHVHRQHFQLCFQNVHICYRQN